MKIKIYKTIILTVVLYGCEAWSLTLREECRLRVFENRILRRIYGPRRDENGEWGRLYNEKIQRKIRSPFRELVNLSSHHKPTPGYPCLFPVGVNVKMLKALLFLPSWLHELPISILQT